MFLYYFIQTNYFQQQLTVRSNATAQAGVYLGKLREIPIFYPVDKKYQQKIASILSKVDELIQNNNKIIQSQNSLYECLLATAFLGRVTKIWRNEYPNVEPASELFKRIKQQQNADSILRSNKFSKDISNEIPDIEIPRTWEWHRMDDLIESLTDYHSNGSYAILKKHVRLLDKPDYAFMIRATNFEKNDFSSSMKYITKDAYEFLSKSKLFGGEILIGKIGNAGAVYYMPYLNHPCSLAMNLFALRITSLISSKYIYYHLQSPYSKSDIKKYIKGVGNPSIDKKSVRSIWISLPPFKEQQKIVSIFDSITFA